MKNFILISLVSFISCTFIGCTTSFTQREKQIIYDSPGKSARVLQINSNEDSLVLRTKSVNVKGIKKNKDLLALLEKLRITMEAESGVGIAAPQIGINKKIFLFLRLDKPGQPVEVAINPKIISHPKETLCFLYDGCLSVPDKYGNSVRYPWIEVRYKNEKGENLREKLSGESRLGDYTGIIFQHEYDHIQGILYIDKLCKPE